MSKSICIIGGGVIGLFTAYYAMREGHRVTILERGKPDHDACSLGNAGMIVPSHFVPLAAPGMVSLGLRMMLNPKSPFTIRPRLDRDLAHWSVAFARASTAAHVARSAPLLLELNLASRACYAELAAQWENVFELTQNGLLMLCKSARMLDAEAHLAEQARELGLAAHVLNREQTARRDPDIRMDVAGSVYFPQDCHLSPGKLLARLTQELQQNGACFAWSTEVTGWRSSDGRIDAAQTNQGDVTADEYVISGGSWSPSVVRGLNIRLPLQAGKGYSITLPHPKQQPNLCSILTEARVAVTPMGDTLRFGGTMEVSGLLDTRINANRVQGILQAIPNYFPDFTPADFHDMPVWSGLRPCSPDGLPYIGRFPSYQNLSAATGHAMMGISLAPITGKLMAAILSNAPTPIDVGALSPDRY